jgi:fructokinase
VRIGIDLGGTKIEAIALADDGKVLVRRRAATPRHYERTVAAIADLVAGVEAGLGLRGTVGVGMPGTLTGQEQRVTNANSTWLIGRPFAHDLAAALDRPVRCANDANCLALSEAHDGAAAAAGTAFAVILGTGVGGGITVDGRIVEGADGLAGEWGHNPLPWAAPEELPGPDCYCGKRGCIETWLAGPALARDHRERTGADLDPPAVAAVAAAGDPYARASVARYADRLARALATVINVVDPDVIVLAGGVSNIDALLTEVPPRLPRWVFGGQWAGTLRRALHGDSSGVRGAAWLWP